LYLKAPSEHISSDPHCDSWRANRGSLFAASGQNRPRAEELHAGFRGIRGCSANPLTTASIQRTIRFTSPFSA
jgi:hypothetical protein